MKCCAPALIALVTFAVPATVRAADPRFPDWPCNQIKVPELSVAAVWGGPAIDDVGSAWQDDPHIREVVERLAARRTALDEAQKTISDFLAGDAAARQQRAKLIFAGLFKSLDHQRSEVMNGIERMFRQQKAFADTIRSETRELRELQDKGERDQSRLDELTNRLEWQTRIFEERRTTIRYACEVPVLIEQRLFALSRMIQQSLE